MRYVFHLALRQVKPGEKDKYKQIYQINLNLYDFFGKGEFIYKSFLMEEKCHLKRNSYLTIYDINLDLLRKKDYNEIMEEEYDSLEKLLYIFVCEKEDKRDKLCEENEIMEKVNAKIKELTKDFDALLCYDLEEHNNQVIFEMGEEKGIEKEKRKIATNMLKDGIDKKIIAKYTNLPEEEIEQIEEKE